MSTQQITPEPAISEEISPRLKRKLDKHLRMKERKAVKAKPRGAAKPIWEKNLSRNTAARLFRRENLMEKFAELLNTQDARLRFEVMRYLWDRLEGKPFVAENPNVHKPVSPIIQDQRVQLAIQNLILPAAKQKRSKTVSQTVSPEPKLLNAQVMAENAGFSPKAEEPTQAAAKAGDGQEN